MMSWNPLERELVRGGKQKEVLRHSVKNILGNINSVLQNAHISSHWVPLFIFEDSDAVIKLMTKGWSSTMRDVSRNHHVDFEWLFDR